MRARETHTLHVDSGRSMCCRHVLVRQPQTRPLFLLAQQSDPPARTTHCSASAATARRADPREAGCACSPQPGVLALRPKESVRRPPSLAPMLCLRALAAMASLTSLTLGCFRRPAAHRRLRGLRAARPLPRGAQGAARRHARLQIGRGVDRSRRFVRLA